MTRLRLRGFVVLGTTALLFVLTLCSAGAALAATPTTVWSPAGQIGLPTGATGAGTTLPGVSCTAVGGCEAVGSYTNAAGTVVPMALTQTAGAWSQTTAPAPPMNAGVSASALQSVSCAAAGVCTAVGDDTDASASQAITAVQTAGVWGPAAELTTLPAGATGAALDSVSCASAGNCGAVGSYVSGGATQAMVVSSTGGAWGQATGITLPAGAASTGQVAVLDGVSCTTPGNCAAVGHYVNTGGATEAMGAVQVGGNWGTAFELTVPSGASSASLDSISCVAEDCAAVGSDVDGTGQTQGLTVNENAGSFGAAGQLTLPSAAVATGQSAVLDSVSCASAGDCTATGSYIAGGFIAPMGATESNGAWGAATSLGEPAGAVSSATATAITLAVGCFDAERCTAAGIYPMSAGVGVLALVSHPSLSISVSHLPNAAVGSAYSTQLTTSGGTGGDVWSIISGGLPAGLSLNPSTGVISGTPTTDQTTSFAVAVSDNASPADSASLTLALTVGPTVNTPKKTTAKPTKKTSSKKRKTKKVFRGARVSDVKVLHHDTLHLSVRCIKRRHCVGRVSLIVVEHLRGHRLLAITATTHRRTRVRRKTVVFATMRYVLRSGHRVTRTLHLDPTGLRLLARHKTLTAALTQRPSSAKRAHTIRKKLSLHQPKPKTKKKKSKKTTTTTHRKTRSAHHKTTRS